MAKSGTKDTKAPLTCVRRSFDESERDDKASAQEAVPMAVALDYDPLGGDAAPRVVASGKGFVAEQILHLAFENGVRVRKDADLVQVLSAVEIDSEIPVEAFMAVAEIIAYVYRANREPLPWDQPHTKTNNR